MQNLIPIDDLSIPALRIYAALNETQLLHYYEPRGGLFIAETPMVIGRALDAGYTPVSLLIEERHLEGDARALAARCPDVPIYTAKASVLSALTGFPLTRGALCAMRRRPLPDIASLCASARRIAVLERVMNPANVGAIFRSAAALGIDAVLLTPGCSDPLYRRAVRVSMGSVFQIPWSFFPDGALSWPEQGMALLRELRFRTAAMALSDDSVPVDAPALLSEERLAIVLGSEGDGLSSSTIASCDYTVRIPMSRGVDSLNVAAASAVVFWQLTRRQKEAPAPGADL